MPKTCYIHVGLHKTATSSFQKTCGSSVDLLQKTGITYPQFSCAAANRRGINNHSIPILSLFLEKPEEYHINKRWGILNCIKEVNSSYAIQLEGFLDTSPNILISGEGISLLSAQSLSRLIDKIHYYDYEIKATALIRSPYSMFCSQVQEQIKGGKYFDLISLSNCVPSFFDAKPYSCSGVVKKLGSVFGEDICFHGFEHACTHSSGPVGFLLEEFLGRDPSVFEYKKTNESLSNLSARLQNEFNAVNPAFVDNNYNANFRGFPVSVDQRFEFTGKFLLTEVEYALIEEFVERETEDLKKIAGVDFSAQALRFSKPIF